MSRNLLDLETSPYLLQHQDNPVHWMPWSTEALDKAREEDKPILLSVGYAACHWCHVMAHESFEDDDTAAVMNELFINIKVDREERPDIDRIYMTALHHLGEQGGWPLTMFLTPDGEPFWGGTYFPKTGMYGRPAFVSVLREVARIYREERNKVDVNRQALVQALNTTTAPDATFQLTMNLVDQFATRALELVDKIAGGLKGAPKFPQTMLFSLFWRTWLRKGKDEFKQAVEVTLTHISQGGIYDHIGGGFARYSVDPRWLAPHFEKMLYDNALLVELLTLVWQETREPLYKSRVEETVQWLFREMIADGGGFAASLDADSEGEEGRFYVWSADQIDQVLGDDAELFRTVYDIHPGGNWEGHSIPNRLSSLRMRSDEEEAKLAACREILLEHRASRIRPGWDDKVLTDWNGLMISALSFAGMTYGKSEWVDAAIRAFRFITESMSDGDRLFHSYRAGEARHLANADGYANMTKAALNLYEATGENIYLDQARSWHRVLKSDFWDENHNGLYYTSRHAEGLIARTRTAADDAIPNANATTVANLARLHAVTGDAEYRSDADAILSGFSSDMKTNLFGHAGLLNGFETLLDVVQIVLVGDRDDPGAQALMDEVSRHSIPGRMIAYAKDPDALPENHPAAGKTNIDGRPTVYVCHGTICSLPVTEPDQLSALLARKDPD